MNIQELRIGNWYKWYAEGQYYYYQVEAKDFLNKYYKNFEPIELTEEILLKCGFEKRGLYWFDKHLDERTKFTFEWYVDGRTSFSISILKKEFDITCEHLHQLQNIYRCLTNEELKINL